MKRILLPAMMLWLAACRQPAPGAGRTIKTINVAMDKLPTCEQTFPSHLDARGPMFADSIGRPDTGEKPLADIPDPLDIRPFTGVPKVKGDCLLGVATEQEQFRRNSFILAGSGRIMQLQVGHKTVFLRAVDKDLENFFEWWFKGHGYQVHLKMLHRQDSEENTFVFDGYMEIKYGAESIVVAVYGGGGC